jgi:hypothetical protein
VNPSALVSTEWAAAHLLVSEHPRTAQSAALALGWLEEEMGEVPSNRKNRRVTELLSRLLQELKTVLGERWAAFF